MKKTIAISIITSAMLFGATVTNLSTDQVNQVTGSTLDDVTLDQGKTAISGSANVDTLTITQRGATAAETGNSVTNLTINGNTSSTTLVSQGTTDVSNSTVHNVTIDSDSIINGGSVSGAGELTQGKTAVGGGSTLENVGIESTNTINNAAISASGSSEGFLVTQGTLSVSGDANASDATANLIDLSSTNIIDDGVSIADSRVEQALTQIDGSGTTASGLNLLQENTLNGTGVITNGSIVLQAVTKIDTGADVHGLKTNVKNNMNSLNSDNSTVVQNHINIHTDSVVTDMDISTGGTNHNTISNVSATDSTITQNTYNITNGSNINGITAVHDNIISNSTFNGAHIGQDLVDINNSTLTAPVAFNSTNSITNMNVVGANNEIHQAVTVINNATVTAPTLTSNNSISGVDLDNTEISQSSVSIANTTAVVDLVLNNTNTVNDTDGIGNDMNNSKIIQAQFMMSEGSINNLNQLTTNTIEDNQVVGSNISQATISLHASSVTNVDMDATNTMRNNDIDTSDVEQNALRICDGSTVTGLTVNQSNEISGTTVTGSSLTQGTVNIGDVSDCTNNLVAVDHRHKSF